MKIIPYEVSISGHLSDEFARGFKSMSIERGTHNSIATVYLWHADGTGLKIQSRLHDIIDWIEVGALEFSRVTRAVSGVSEIGVCETEVTEINLPNEFGTGLKATKLVLSTHGIAVESGVVLESAGGNEIIIVACSAPYMVAIKAPFIAEAFEPEYDLSEYSREPINQNQRRSKQSGTDHE